VRDVVLLLIGALIGVGGHWLASRLIDQPHQRRVRREVEREATYKAMAESVDPIIEELGESGLEIQVAAERGTSYTAGWWRSIDDALVRFEIRWREEWRHTLGSKDKMTVLYGDLWQAYGQLPILGLAGFTKPLPPAHELQPPLVNLYRALEAIAEHGHKAAHS
jgi:hypothetical protein